MLALCVVAGRTSTGITPWGTHSSAGLIDAKAYLGLFSCQVSSAKPLWHVAIPPTRFGNIDALLRVGEAQTNWFSLSIRPVITKTIQATLADRDALNEDVRQRQAIAFSGTASHIRCAGYHGSEAQTRFARTSPAAPSPIADAFWGSMARWSRCRCQATSNCSMAQRGCLSNARI